MICAEVSIYPLKTGHASEVITNAIDSLNDHEIEYRRLHQHAPARQ